ncbi:hypothetical protein scyTo_0024135, partial [Scyliorhinus torazame]|nr:hypothetical protein [Scyliorhinus torazame]
MFGNKVCGAPNCSGALSEANAAKNLTDDTRDQMNDLLGKLQNTISRIGSLRNMTEETKEKAIKLSHEVNKTKDAIEKEKQESKATINKVKEFLT